MHNEGLDQGSLEHQFQQLSDLQFNVWEKGKPKVKDLKLKNEGKEGREREEERELFKENTTNWMNKAND